jgi:hypothetical protein
MLIYASSCEKYFLEHGDAFITSAKKQGHTVKVDMTDDFPEWRKRLGSDRERIFACNLRFLRLPDLLEQDDVLVCDIDSIINQPIKFDDCDLALYLRPWIDPTKERLQVLLTASYWSKRAKPFAEIVREKLLSQELRWCDDQRIVWRVYNEIGHQFKIQNLDHNFVNFNFDRDAPIWTCKGPARKTNKVYLARKSEYVETNPANSSAHYQGAGVAKSVAI